VITVRNAWTLPQERYNAEWLEENGTGIVLKRHGQAGAAVASLLSGGRLAPMREAAQRIVNRAVFEIPAILEQILDLASSRR
jgi:1,2-diacylglycerol 3-beta-galactosyltransferase